MLKKLIVLMLLALTIFTGCKKDEKVEKKSFKMAWSHYTGWEPWAYADSQGIIKKWADKYGIEIELVLVNDYIESINLYTAGEYDGCTMTNMDALTIPAVGGIDSTALIIGDFSNGNDGIVLKNGSSVADMAGRKVKLVELSVSHYLLARALELNGLKESDVTVVNTSDADIGSVFLSDRDEKASVVTWNPILMQIKDAENCTLVFDSSMIPGEIIDMAVVRSDVDDKFKKALTGAWYETMEHLITGHANYEQAISFMAEESGATADEFKKQLETTEMFYNAGEAVNFSSGAGIKATMEYVRSFSFDHGLYGEGAESKDYVGIEFPDRSVIGDESNVKLRFDDTYMKLAAEGKL